MSSWQILIFNMLILLSSPQQTPTPLTPQQQQQFEIAFNTRNFKPPQGAL